MKNKKVFFTVPIIILSVIIVICLMDETVSQFICIFGLFVLGAWLLIKGIKILNNAQLIVLMLPIIAPYLIKIFAQTTFAHHMSMIYNSAFLHFCNIINVEYQNSMGSESSVSLTFWAVFTIILLLYGGKDSTAMKMKKGKDEEEFKQKNYAQKSEMFCKTLRQKLESLNRETDWNEDLYTPIEAEIELETKGRNKKRFGDLLKCLKSVRHRGKIFLLLGAPGGGKSVSLRKLCLELLDESKRTRKIPVYINLKKWNRNWDVDHLPNKKDLIDFIKATLYENGDFLTDEFLNTYFDKMLEDGRWYFVFDSFDEMPCLMGKQNCREVIDGISELLYNFLTGTNQNGGIIASRMYRCPSEALGATVVLKLQDFNDIKIKTMIQKYLNHAELITKELFGKREDLVILCRNPFYLTLLINYIKEKGLKFPQNQMQLYQNFVIGRLNKCSGKLESEKITLEEANKAAKELAVIIQNSENYGLDCPVDVLIKEKSEQYWSSVLRVLEYAKICRFSEQNKVVSFVHRRFQEFFLVENIMEQKKSIGDAEYKGIVNNSHLRDALVLYCEVIDQNKAKEVAGYCWDVVKKNIVHSRNVLEKGGVDLINALYFMAEAFRNRKEVISDYVKEFEQLVCDGLSQDTDIIILRALTSSMVLFNQDYLQQMILTVFQLKNRWLNDLMVQNCRIIKKLDSNVETQFVKYIFRMDLRTFFKRFRNMQFSFSNNKSFKYIRLIHILRLLAEILCAVSVMGVGLYVLIHVDDYLFDFIKNIKRVSLSELWVSITAFFHEPVYLNIDRSFLGSVLLFIGSMLAGIAFSIIMPAELFWEMGFSCVIATIGFVIVKNNSWIYYMGFIMYFVICIINFIHDINRYNLITYKCKLKKIWTKEIPFF